MFAVPVASVLDEPNGFRHVANDPYDLADICQTVESMQYDLSDEDIQKIFRYCHEAPLYLIGVVTLKKGWLELKKSMEILMGSDFNP